MELLRNISMMSFFVRTGVRFWMGMMSFLVFGHKCWLSMVVLKCC
jgi:hypothetical protein